MMKLLNKLGWVSGIVLIPAAITFSQLSTEQCGVVLGKERRSLVNSISDELAIKLDSFRGVSQSDVCVIPTNLLRKAISKIDHPKPDHPGEAMAQRYQQSLSANGELNAENWRGAREQVKQMQRIVRPGAGISPAAWENLGPGNIGGRIRSLAFDPDDATRIYAGAVAGGVWLTENSGTSWSALDDFMANLSVSTLMFDPNDSQVIYAGTGEITFNFERVRGNGIFKSTDKGQTWSQLLSTQDNSSFYWISRITSLSDSSRLFAGTQTGIWHSEDSGVSWTQSYSGRNNDIDVHPSNDLKVIAGLWGSALYSEDGGITWSNATGLDSISGGRVELAYARSTSDTVYASIDSNSGEIYKSTDGGQSYSLISTGNNYLSAQGWYDNALWVDPVNSDHVIVGGLDLWRSTDGGVNFTKISTWWQSPSSAHADHHFIIEDPNYDASTNNRVYFANDGGVYVTEDVTVAMDSVGWQELNNQLSITQFYGMGVSSDGTIVAGAQDNGTLIYKGDSEDWTETFGGDGGFSASDPIDSNYIYGEYVYLRIHRSTNGGVSSGNIYSTEMTDDGPNFIAPFILDPNDENRLLGGALQMWVSDDAKANSPTWVTKKDTIGSPISAIAVAKANSDLIYVGHNNGSFYKTTDGTSDTPTWIDVDDGNLPQRYLMRIAIDPLDSDIVYASFGGYNFDNLWKSTDAGATWSSASGTSPTNIPAAPVRSIVTHPTNTQRLYVGTEVGIFTSENGGTSWSLANDGPANVSVDELVWDASGALFAATHGRGVFRAVLDNTAPNDIIFVDQTEVEFSTFIESEQGLISGLSQAVDVTITGGEYSIGCDGNYTAAPGSANNGDIICLSHTSANTEFAETLTQVTIGSSTFDFTSITISDVTPDAFSFQDVVDVEVSSSETSNTATITGISFEAAISVTGGDYSIGCDGNFTDVAGTISLNDTVCLRHTSSPDNLTTVITTITIGDTAESFSSTTIVDATPDEISFGTQVEVAFDSEITSNTVTLTSFQIPLSISISNGEYSIGCTETFTSDAGVINENDTLCLKHTSGNGFYIETQTDVTIGAEVSSFLSKTMADTTPDDFSFNSLTDVETNVEQVSNLVLVSGISFDTNISVTGGEYSVGCNGIYSTASARVLLGESICVKHTSAVANLVTVTTNLTLGGITRAFSTTTVADTEPDPINFGQATNTPLNSPMQSFTETISGIQIPVSVTIENGEYSIGCNGSFTSDLGEISSGETICIKHTSANDYYVETISVVTIGGYIAEYSTRTKADITPSDFSFIEVLDADLNVELLSNVITVSDITFDVGISILNGEYSTGCNNTFTSEPGSISEGDTVCVRHTSSSNNFSVIVTELTIGDVTENYSSTTLPDTTPEGFSFTAQDEITTGTEVTSEIITLTGFQVSIPISVTNGEYSIGCSSTFTSDVAEISPDQTVCLKHNSSDQYVTQTITTLNVNGITADFVSATEPDRTPDNFTFASIVNVEVSTQQVSETVAVSGIAVDVDLSVTGGEYSLGCNGTFSSATVPISEGQTICLRHNSSASFSANNTTSVTVGTYSTSFVSTTKTAPPTESSGGGSLPKSFLLIFVFVTLMRRVRA